MEYSENFEDIYQTYQPGIYRYLSRLAGTEDAKDLTQEVFIKIHRGFKDFRGDSRLSTWIYRIAGNVLKDWWKRPQYKRECSADIGQKDCFITGREDEHPLTGHKPFAPDELIIRQEMNQCYRNYITRLPEDLRKVYILSDLEGQSARDVSAALQITVENVKIRLHRARTRLYNDLRKGCIVGHDHRGDIICEERCPGVKNV